MTLTKEGIKSKDQLCIIMLDIIEHFEKNHKMNRDEFTNIFRKHGVIR